MAARRRVAITGMGLITPLGGDLPLFWKGLENGENGIGPITLFPARTFPVRFGGEVKGESWREALPPRYLPPANRASSLGLYSALSSLEDAGLDPGLPPCPPARCGVFMGCETGRPDLHTLAGLYRAEEGHSIVEVPSLRGEFLRNLPSTLASLLMEHTGFCGPSVTVSAACTSSSQAVGEAFDAVRRGEADLILAGGADSLIDPIIIAGFHLLGALSTRNDEPERASRPFDLKRDGFVLGEGGGCVVLEEMDLARERGAKIYAELAGYGCSSNAYRMTDSPPGGEGAALAMTLALKDAGLPAGEVDYINAHGTSTPQNDASETAAIRSALGKRAFDIPVSSIKSMTGHLVAGGGVVELIATVLAIQKGIIPPTINYEFPDPSCDLYYVPNRAIRMDVRVAMNNSFGFGGLNAVHIVKRVE